LNQNLPYKSVNAGVVHMCGQDGHTACLMVAILYLIDNKLAIP